MKNYELSFRVNKESSLTRGKFFIKRRSILPSLTEDKINYHSWQEINGSNVQNYVITAAAELETSS